MASSISTGGRSESTARFTLSEDCRVIAEDGHFVEPGSGEVGAVALRGRTPVGYYKDDEKSARTFRVIDGVRWSIPGDLASIDADGTLVLLGRGSAVINTGGEKVFAEEVEEVLKGHPSVRDAVVVGVPDPRFGQAIAAVVEPVPGEAPDGDDLVALVKASLAAYKAPRHVLTVDSLDRKANGKVDHGRWRDHATEVLTGS
jgi:fatty-acyl-CoA synthase